MICLRIGYGRQAGDWWKTSSGVCLLAQRTAIAAVALLFVAGIWAQEEVPLEYRVKAAFVYNFTKMVEWPPEAGNGGAEIVVGIVGEDPFRGSIEKAAGEAQGNVRKLIVKRLKWSDSPWKCHVLFISVSEKRHVAQILAQLGDKPVLTVSEIGGFAQTGGMIEFVFDEDRVRFDVNREAAQRANLRIDARLLAVAHAVKRRN